jgi:cytochrome P450
METLARWVLFFDPPLHTPLRKAINRALTLRLITQMTSHIQALTEQLIDCVYAQGRMDIIRDLAYPLPAIVIAEMLGARPEDRDQLKRWSDDIARFLGTKTASDVAVQIQDSVLALIEYLRHVLERHRAEPMDNLMGSLLAFQHQHRSLTDADLLANCAGLIFAGHETTTNLIANGLLTLLRHPAQRDVLQRDPALSTRAVEECLRYESPVQRLGRISREDIDLATARIQQGQLILLLIGASNRDPKVFENPNAFDITRHDNPRLAFGYGIHLCPGAALGRLEAQLAINTVLRRLQLLTLVLEKPQWQYNLSLRTLEALPVTFAP